MARQVTVDRRRRVNLTGIGRPSDKTYVVTERADGTIILRVPKTPTVTTLTHGPA